MPFISRRGSSFVRGRVFGLRGFSCYLFAIFKVLFDRVEGFVIVGVFLCFLNRGLSRS